MAESCRVILQTFLCAFHGVSPRDRWLRVLPGWQMNVNVNFTDFKLTARPQVHKGGIWSHLVALSTLNGGSPTCETYTSGRSSWSRISKLTRCPLTSLPNPSLTLASPSSAGCYSACSTGTTLPAKRVRCPHAYPRTARISSRRLAVA